MESGLEAIGWSSMRELNPYVYEDMGIAIGPDFVGKGYGKQILNALCEEARKQGTKEFHCSYREKNLASKRLQDACGFKFDYKSEEKTDPRTGEKYVVVNTKNIYCGTENMDFIEALKIGDMEAIRKCPKTDLHNHFVLGGSRIFLFEHSGRDIRPITNPLNSMDEMHAWNGENIGSFFDTTEGRRMLINATFTQAKEDGVTILEIGEDVWGLGAFFNNDIDELVDAFESAHREIAPEIELRLQIGMSRHCDIAYLEDCLSRFWGCKAFYSIDLYGDELAQPIENFIPIYRRAKAEGLRLKAHVGEWGTAEDVRRAVECLELDEVQHGITAVNDPSVVRFLADNKVRLNITPSSNYLLGRVKDLKTHPIAELYHSSVDVTINSDDVLIFDSDVSKEYLRLYQSGCLTAEELDNIRINGLDAN